MRFKDKIVVVTGAASGIGRASVLRFAAEGATVIAADINQAAGAELASQSNGKIYFQRCDVCSVAEIKALRTDEVQAAFAAKNVALLKADWTSHDDAITQALAGMGRSGVPAYALYRTGTTGDATLLPEVLTKNIVLDALDKIGR